MMVFVQRWLVTYWRWTLAPLVTIAIIIFWLVSTIVTTGGGAGRFIFFLFLSAAGITIYRGFGRTMPPGWIMVTAISTPLFLWGFWLLKPEWYMEWRHSKYFLWMILVTIVLGWLASHRTVYLANTARVSLLLLMITAVGMGAYGKLPPGSSYWSTSTTFMVVAGRDWSDSVRVPLGGRIVWEREDNSKAYQFQTQTGVIHTRQGGLVPYTDHGRISSVQFRALENKNIVIRVRITQ